MEKKKRQRQNYIDNKKFLAAKIEFRDSVIEAEEKGERRPMVPNYVAECIMKIAIHLSYKPNFSNYTFKEDMISDGIENCLQYIDNFNPEKSNNPFAYFTQIIYYAFLRRIAKEKKHLYTKYKYMDETGYNLNLQEGDDTNYNIEASKSKEWSREHIDVFIDKIIGD